MADSMTDAVKKSQDSLDGLKGSFDDLSKDAFKKGKEAGDNWQLGFLFSTNPEAFINKLAGIASTKGNRAVYTALENAGFGQYLQMMGIKLTGGWLNNDVVAAGMTLAEAKAIENAVMANPTTWETIWRNAYNSGDVSILTDWKKKAGITDVIDISSLIKALNYLGDASLADKFSILSDKFSFFATGGLVTSPTLGLVGEAGPELILPLDRVGVGNTFYITISANTYEGGVAAAAGLADELISRGLMA